MKEGLSMPAEGEGFGPERGILGFQRCLAVVQGFTLGPGRKYSVKNGMEGGGKTRNFGQLPEVPGLLDRLLKKWCDGGAGQSIWGDLPAH